MIKRKDLVDFGNADYDIRRNEFMQCQDCGAEFGGTQGDYFIMPMNDIFYCPECTGDNIALVRRESKIVVVKQ